MKNTRKIQGSDEIRYDYMSNKYYMQGHRNAEHVFTVLLKGESDGRGEYSEEIDIRIPNTSESLAREVAQRVIDANFIPGTKIGKIIYRPPGFMYF